MKNMKGKSLKMNVMLNGLQQLVTLLLPFVTVPYLTRVIGKEGIGTYSYTNSIIQYFILFGTIGLSLYGTREIAYVRGNKKKRDQIFWKIQLLRTICCLVALLLYSLFLLIYKTDLKKYMLIQIIPLLANMIDILWFFQGIEEFRKIVYRSILCRLIGTISIFLFVRSEHDVGIYILFQGLILFLGNAALWIPAKRIISVERVQLKDIFLLFRPAISLFIPQVAIELYAVFDKTMLGMLSTIGDVGLYSKAEEFAKVPLMLISVIATALFPRMSNVFAEKGKEALIDSLNNNIKLISFIGVGASFGVFAIANGFVQWMMGEEFLGSILLMQLMAPLSFLIGLSNMIGRQFLLPSNQNKLFTLTVSIGAAVNFILNIIFIRRWGAVGACIATLLAEGSVTLSQFLIVRKYIRLKSYFLDLAKCIVAGFIMFSMVLYIGEIVEIPVINTIVQISVGVLIYIGILILMRNFYAKFVMQELIQTSKRIFQHIHVRR